jgi:hypothetical protein
MLDWPHLNPYPWSEWEPVRPVGSPWLSQRPIPVKVARTYVAASGPFTEAACWPLLRELRRGRIELPIGSGDQH